MYVNRLLLLFTVSFILPAYANNICTQKAIGYYWRDYAGVIPYDAVPGGVDRSGQITYIGQVYIRGQELLPATIVAGSTTAITSSHNRAWTATKNIKILCSTEQEKFSWLLTDTNSAHLITNCHLIIGGSQQDKVLYIGRINRGGETVVGKVSIYPPGRTGITVPDEKRERHHTSYEILTYDCNNNHNNIGK